MNLLWIFVIAFGLASSSAFAQYSSLEQNTSSAKEKKELELASAREKIVGKQFWIAPNTNASTRKVFIAAWGDGSIGSEKFMVTESTSFTVQDFAAKQFRNYVKIVFADGKIAYLEENVLFKVNPNDYSIFDDLYELGQRRYDFIEYILPVSPENLRIIEQKFKAKSIASAAAWKARGGIRIGMTAKQVRASNWGAPSSINRSTGTFGVHEQWVYGGGNYVYLQNGTVTSFQN